MVALNESQRMTRRLSFRDVVENIDPCNEPIAKKPIAPPPGLSRSFSYSSTSHKDASHEMHHYATDCGSMVKTLDQRIRRSIDELWSDDHPKAEQPSSTHKRTSQQALTTEAAVPLKEVGARQLRKQHTIGANGWKHILYELHAPHRLDLHEHILKPRDEAVSAADWLRETDERRSRAKLSRDETEKRTRLSLSDAAVLNPSLDVQLDDDSDGSPVAHPPVKRPSLVRSLSRGSTVALTPIVDTRAHMECDMMESQMEAEPLPSAVVPIHVRNPALPSYDVQAYIESEWYRQAYGMHGQIEMENAYSPPSSPCGPSASSPPMMASPTMMPVGMEMVEMVAPMSPTTSCYAAMGGCFYDAMDGSSLGPMTTAPIGYPYPMYPQMMTGGMPMMAPLMGMHGMANLPAEMQQMREFYSPPSLPRGLSPNERDERRGAHSERSAVQHRPAPHGVSVALPLSAALAFEQDGSRRLQMQMMSMSSTKLAVTVSELSPHLGQLCTHLFGNYLVSKMASLPAAQAALHVALRGRVVELLKHAQGSRVMQAAIDAFPNAMAHELINELRSHVVEVSMSTNGSWGVVAAFKRAKPPFVVAELAAQLMTLSTCQNGSRVVQRVLPEAAAHGMQPELDAVWTALDACGSSHTTRLALDSHANYVVQIALRLGTTSAELRPLVHRLAQSIDTLARSKCGSNVAEVLVSVAPPEVLLEISQKLERSSDLEQHCFGRHVVTALNKRLMVATQ